MPLIEFINLILILMSFLVILVEKKIVIQMVINYLLNLIFLFGKFKIKIFIVYLINRPACCKKFGDRETFKLY